MKKSSHIIFRKVSSGGSWTDPLSRISFLFELNFFSCLERNRPYKCYYLLIKLLFERLATDPSSTRVDISSWKRPRVSIFNTSVYSSKIDSRNWSLISHSSLMYHVENSLSMRYLGSWNWILCAEASESDVKEFSYTFTCNVVYLDALMVTDNPVDSSKVLGGSSLKWAGLLCGSSSKRGGLLSSVESSIRGGDMSGSSISWGGVLIISVVFVGSSSSRPKTSKIRLLGTGLSWNGAISWESSTIKDFI